MSSRCSEARRLGGRSRRGRSSGDAGDRLRTPAVARCNRRGSARASSRAEGERLFRRRERRDRIPLGREPARPAANADERTGPQAGLCDRRGGGSNRRWRPRRPPRPSPSSSMSERIRSGSVWFPASLGRAAMSQGTIFSRANLSPSTWKYCASWYPQRPVSRCSSTRPI